MAGELAGQRGHEPFDDPLLDVRAHGGIAVALLGELERAQVPVKVRAAATATAPVVVTTTAGVRIEVNEVDATTAEWVMLVMRGDERS